VESEKVFVIPQSPHLPGVAIAASYPNGDLRVWWAPGFTSEQQKFYLEALYLSIEGVVMTSECPWVEVDGLSLPFTSSEKKVVSVEDFVLFEGKRSA